MTEHEIWKPSIYNSDYWVSNLGQVAKICGKTFGIISPNISHGYERVYIKTDGININHGIHFLVAREFCPIAGCITKKIVCHRDDNKTNNSAKNLYWGTYKENSIDASRNVKLKTVKLKPDDVRKIRALKGTDNAHKIGKYFDVSGSTIARIWSGYGWTHVS